MTKYTPLEELHPWDNVSQTSAGFLLKNYGEKKWNCYEKNSEACSSGCEKILLGVNWNLPRNLPKLNQEKAEQKWKWLLSLWWSGMRTITVLKARVSAIRTMWEWLLLKEGGSISFARATGQRRLNHNLGVINALSSGHNKSAQTKSCQNKLRNVKHSFKTFE